MRNILKIILFTAIMLLLFGLAISFYIQQKSIKALQDEITNLKHKPVSSVQNSEINSDASSLSPVLLKDVLTKINDVWGEIKEIKGKTITVDARVVNASEQPQTIIKRYTITVDPETYFTSKKLSELKIGDYVRVFSNNPVYQVNAFVARDISYLTAEDLSLMGN